MAVHRSHVPRSLAGYASLVRVPNLFTAPPDVLLGAALGAVGGGGIAVPSLAGLVIASMLLYAAGTTLNDYFDAAEDARTRPERPIPSGQVSRPAALGLGLLFLTGGILVAVMAAGVRAGVVAGLLAAVILLYDGLLKGGPAGFLAMGTARGFNVWLGTTATASLVAGPAWPLVVPVAIACYIAAVTYMAETEVEGEDRDAVLVAAGGVLAATAVLGFILLVVRPPGGRAVTAILLGGGFLAWTGRGLRDAYADPIPANVGAAVGTCILGLILLDAAIAAVTDLRIAAAAALMLTVAAALSHRFDVS